MTYPFKVERGEARTLAIELPVEGQVPEGFIFVPGGRFLFGTSHDEFLRRFFSTVPQHAVELGPYMIARTEVTFAQYIEYLDTLSAEARSKRSAESKATGPLMAGVSLRELSPKRWELSFAINADVKYVVAQGESIVFQGRTTNISQDWLQLPATGLSWKDAEDYIRWLDETGRVPGARFCTEWEWERAARGADERIYPHADRLRPTDANFDMTYGRDASRWGPDQVGSHPGSASVFGAQDFVGNVWEWTRSSLNPDERILRGGSFSFEVVTCSSVNRAAYDPEARDGTIGLRVCASWPLKTGSG